MWPAIHNAAYSGKIVDLRSRLGTDNQFADAWMKDSISALVDEQRGWKPMPNLLYWVTSVETSA